MPGFESRLLEPDDTAHDTTDTSSSSATHHLHASSSLPDHASSLPHQRSSSSHSHGRHSQSAKHVDMSQRAQQTPSSAAEMLENVDNASTLPLSILQGRSGAALQPEQAESSDGVVSDQPLHKLGSYRIADFELDEEDTASAGSVAASDAMPEGSSASHSGSAAQHGQPQPNRPRTHAHGKGKTAGVQVGAAC